MDSPFSGLKNELEALIMADQTGDKPIREKAILVLTQLRLLHVQYDAMAQRDMIVHHTEYDAIRNQQDLQIKNVLDFFTFINVLNQFGRILERRYGISIPLKNRIRFYRNKVSEHWDQYTQYAVTGSQFQARGKIAIPMIAHTFIPEERRTIKDELDIALGERLDVDNPDVSNVLDIPGNTEKLYTMLERIDPNLGKLIPERVVELLFKFGFPSPIRDVEVYSIELVRILKSSLSPSRETQ